MDDMHSFQSAQIDNSALPHLSLGMMLEKTQRKRSTYRYSDAYRHCRPSCSDHVHPDPQFSRREGLQPVTSSIERRLARDSTGHRVALSLSPLACCSGYNGIPPKYIIHGSSAEKNRGHAARVNRRDISTHAHKNKVLHTSHCNRALRPSRP